MRRWIVGASAALAACQIDAVTFTPPDDSFCGDGVVDLATEACDDGNTTNGDGCDLECTPGPVYVKASNAGPADIFGSSVALSADGSTMAVGAYNESSDALGVGGDQMNDRAMSSGAVYVFARSGTTWIQEAYIKASNTDPTDNFGFSVALSADGSTLAVGAYQEDSAAQNIDGNQQNDQAMDAGAVYVFTRVGATWGQEAYVKAPNTNAGDNFGFRVALSADGATLAVGAPGEDGVNESLSNAGAVYVFTRLGMTWTHQISLRASGLDVGDAFGVGLALSGDGATLAGGADFDDGPNNGLSNAGAVYMFTRSGTTWAQRQVLRASSPGSPDLFGFYVALSDDGAIVAVGAHQEDGANDTLPDAGAVYVFARGATTWSEQAYVHAPDPDRSDLFGRSLALSGDGATLAVGAHQEDSAATGVGGNQSDESATNSGAVHVFRRSGTTWSPSAYVKATNTGVGDLFGSGLALSRDGSILAVGANHEASAAKGVGGAQDDNSVPDAGAVYVFAN